MTETKPAATTPERAPRAPTDVLRLAVAVVVLVALVAVGALFGNSVVGFVSDLYAGLSALPTWFITALVVLGEVLVLVVLGGGLVVTIVHRRWVLLGSALLAAVLGAGLFLLFNPLADASQASVAKVDESYTLLDADRALSPGGLAAAAAVVTAAAPWVSRRWRRMGWLLVVVAAVVRFLGAPVSFDTTLALACGWTAGALVVVLIGAPSRRPTGEAIGAGLAAVGVELARLEPASVDARGSTPYFGTTTAGADLFVKALGDDERSADLLFRAYRRLQPRDLGDERAFSSLRRAVEHEALVALAARDLGVQTPRLAAFATAEPSGFVLAYEAIAGRSLDRLAPDELSDEVLAGVWAQLALLRHHRVAHRDLRLANVFLADDGVAWIIDFGFSELAASDLLLATDLAEFLASSTTTVGVERAVAAGRAAVGAEVLATAEPRLQLPMLSGATRSALKASPGVLDELRAQVTAVSA